MPKYKVKVVVEEGVPQYQVDVMADDPVEAAVKARRKYQKLTDRDIYTVKYCDVEHPPSANGFSGTLVIADLMDDWLFHRPDYKHED